MKILTDTKLLSKPSVKCASIARGKRIGEKLEKVLQRNPHGIGLSAPQIGIFEQVFYTHLIYPYVFVNPVIVAKSIIEIEYEEMCLSIPNFKITTSRPKMIIWNCDNWRTEFRSYDLRSVLVQHEIDHLHGLLITRFGEANEA